MATRTVVAKTVAIRIRNKTTATKMAGTTIKKRSNSIPAPTQKAMDLFPEPSKTDVNGSYTGRPKNKEEIPVQDADDL